MQPRSLRRPLPAVAALVLGTGVAVSAPGTASAAASTGHTISPSARFFVPPPADGSVQQIAQLAKQGDLKDAALLAEMEAVPSAVWLTGGTPAQVAKQVRTTLVEASLERAEPVFVVYDIPGRDCSEYSAGGAADQAAYQSWVDAVAAAVPVIGSVADPAAESASGVSTVSTSSSEPAVGSPDAGRPPAC